MFPAKIKVNYSILVVCCKTQGIHLLNMLIFTLVSQFTHDTRTRHLQVTDQILQYFKVTFRRGENLVVETYTDVDVDYAGSVSDQRSTSDFYNFLCENLITWKRKKQSIVVHSKFRAMALKICELL